MKSSPAREPPAAGSRRRARTSVRRPTDSLRGGVRLVLGSRVSWLDVVQGVAEDLGARLGLEEGERFDVSLALREGVNNAILHGNRRDESKQVEVTFVAHRDRLEIRIKDQGGGFEPRRLPNPIDPTNLYASSGRGVYLIRHYMDEVDLTRVRRPGGEIRMCKWLPGRRPEPRKPGERDRGSTSR